MRTGLLLSLHGRCANKISPLKADWYAVPGERCVGIPSILPALKLQQVLECGTQLVPLGLSIE